MVKRFLKFFHQEFSSIHMAAILLALSSIGSSLLALFRDRLLAGTFGAGSMLDVYYASFRLPDILYIISLSVASINVLIPFILEKLAISKEETNSFLNSVFTTFLLGIILLSAVFFLIMPYLAGIIAPGFSGAEKEQLVSLSRILLLSPFLLGLSNMFSGVIQSFRRFFIYALSPILYNIGIILGIIFFFPKYGMSGIAIGVVLGAFLHLLIQVPGVVKLGFLPKISFNINFSDVKRVILFSFPRTIGLCLNQIVFIFITAMASLLASGSISIFNLSYNLQAVPLSIIGVSYSVAAFPTLARLFVENQKDRFIFHIVSAAKHIAFWAIPFSVLLIVLRAQIIRVIFGYGKFGWSDTRLTAASLAIFSLSITAQALIMLFVRGFYAAGQTKKPVFVNVFSSIFIVASTLLFIWLFKSFESFRHAMEIILRVENLSGSEVLALPLAFSLGTFINLFLLINLFQKEFGKLDTGFLKTIFQIIASSILIGMVSYISLEIFDNIFTISTFIGIFSQGFFAGMFGILAGFGALSFMKNKELEEIVASVKQRFWKADAVVIEHEDLL